MILLSNFLSGTAILIDFVLQAYLWLIIGAIVVSWVNADPWNPIVRFLRTATDPPFRFLRRRLPFLAMGGIDFSPIILVGAITFARSFLVGALFDYAHIIKLRAFM
jgi:YggT family protein